MKRKVLVLSVFVIFLFSACVSFKEEVKEKEYEDSKRVVQILESAILEPSADTYVSWREPLKNFGKEKEIQTQNHDNNKMWGYLKFNLADTYTKGINSAFLELHPVSPSSYGFKAGVYKIIDDNWDETTVTINKCPNYGAKISTVTVDKEKILIDITQYVKEKYSKNKIVSLRVTCETRDTTGKTIILFHSRESDNVNLRPKLIINASATPIEQYYKINATVNPSTWGSINLTPQKEQYTSGEAVNITLSTTMGVILKSWGGINGSDIKNNAIIMNGDKTITAILEKITECSISTEVFPEESGKIVISPMRKTYIPGEIITVSAVSFYGYEFDHWEGNGKEIKDNKLIINCSKVLKAVFREIPETGIPAFPGAEGFGRIASGGRGGDVVYVTNLNPSGPGSLNDALCYQGNTLMRKPRYILFKVSGFVSPGTYLWDHKTHIEYGDFTLAGQTAKGGIVTAGIMAWDKYNLGNMKNMIIRHIRSRPGDTKNGLDDAARFQGAQNLIIDHCSFEWASDEAMQIAENKNITVQNTIFAETLGEHFDRGGILVKYSSINRPNTGISFHHNMFNRVGGRLPQATPHIDEFGRGMNIEISNNLLWDPGTSNGIIKPIYITNWLNEANKYMDWWYNLNLVNNYSYGIPVPNVSEIWTNAGDVSLNHVNTRIYMTGNKINLYPNVENKVKVEGGPGTILVKRNVFPPITYTSTLDVPEYMIKNVGAFPRDAMDRRLLSSVKNRVVSTIPCNKKGADDGYLFDWGVMPIPELDSDDDGMPDWWELYNGLNPLIKDHTGKNLSLKYTSVEGYDNLEVYLNRLSENLVNGKSLVEGNSTLYGTVIEKAEIKAGTIPVAGGNLNIDILLKNSAIKKAEISMALVNAPFVSPAPKCIDLTSKLTGVTISYSTLIPAIRTSGNYAVMVHVETIEGKHDYKIVNFKM